MHAHRTANRRKCRRMKLLCILSGCPRGARKGHISIFAVLFAQQKTERPRGVVLSLSESLAEFRVRRRERCMIRFLPRPVRGRKHFARSERRIVRCQRTTEAQNAADLSRKSGKATFSTVLLRGTYTVPRSFIISCVLFLVLLIQHPQPL